MQWWTVKQLRSRNPRARLAAVQKLGPDEAAALVQPLGLLLSDSDPAIRAAAAAALGGTADDKIRALAGARFAREPEPEVRLAIIKSLATQPSPRSISYFVEALTDPAGEVGWHAARALQALRWQPANGSERAAWHLAVSQFEDAVSCGPAAIEPLTRLTRSIAFQRCIRAVECLSRVGGAQAVKPLLECLISQDFTIRSAAATALGELGDGRAFEPLVHALRDSHHQVCLAACASLGKMGDQRAVEPLLKVLQHGSPDVRTAAVISLGKLRDSQAAGPVIKLLEDSDPDVREAAVTALGLIGSDMAIEPLVLCLIDSQSSIRQGTAYALRRIEPYWERSEAAARAIPRLQQALKSSEYWVRHSAADTLKKLGVSQDRESSLVTDSDGASRKRHAAHGILVSMLSESDREFRLAAAEALGRIGLADAMPPLVERLADTDRNVQTAAARSLEALRWQPATSNERARHLVALERWPELISIGVDAIEPILSVLAWNDAAARRRAMETLVQIGGPRVIASLRGLSADPVEAVREEARSVLAVLETQRPAAGKQSKDVWGETPVVS